MGFIPKDLIERQYLSGLSMAEIAKDNKVSVHKVAYWMKKYQILSRTRSAASYFKHNPNGDPFLIRKNLTYEDKELFDLGIALFLGEGTKKQQFGVRLANSDPKIIKIFIKFLKIICGVKQNKIKAWINIFDDNIYQEALGFWSKQTQIPRENFYSPVIRKRKTGTYKNKSKYGTITILVNNTKLLQQIKSWCNKYLEKYATSQPT